MQIATQPQLKFTHIYTKSYEFSFYFQKNPNYSHSINNGIKLVYHRIITVQLAFIHLCLMAILSVGSDMACLKHD
jgi:hypothetical protein